MHCLFRLTLRVEMRAARVRTTGARIVLVARCKVLYVPFAMEVIEVLHLPGEDTNESTSPRSICGITIRPIEVLWKRPDCIDWVLLTVLSSELSEVLAGHKELGCAMVSKLDAREAPIFHLCRELEENAKDVHRRIARGNAIEVEYDDGRVDVVRVVSARRDTGVTAIRLDDTTQWVADRREIYCCDPATK